MQRRSTDGTFYSAESSRKSRGDFFYDDSDREVVDERRERKNKLQPRRDDRYGDRYEDRYGDRYGETTHGSKNLGQHFAFRKPDYGGVAKRYDRIEKTETPYLTYRAEVQDGQKAPLPTKVVNANVGKRDISVRDASAVSGVISESSYYGDTSVEAISVAARTVTSPPGARRNGANHNSERDAFRGDVTYRNVYKHHGSDAGQKAKNGGYGLSKNNDKRNGKALNANGTSAKGQSDARGNSVQEYELLPMVAASLQGKSKTQRGVEKEGIKRTDSSSTLGGPFGDNLTLEGLMPADASLAKLEKDVGPYFAASRASDLPVGEEIIPASSESSVVGVPAPGFRLRSSDQSARKMLPNGTGKWNRVEARAVNGSTEENFVEKRATEQQSSRRNGQKTLPIVEEPVVVPAVSTETMAIKGYPHCKNGTEDIVVKSRAVVTGERYPEGRDSYCGRDIQATDRRGRHRRRSDENPVQVPTEVHEGFDHNVDEIKYLLSSNSGDGSGRKNERTSEYKTASSGGPSFLPYSSSASGQKKRQFVFKMQQTTKYSDMELSEDYDYERDATFKSCRTGGSGKLSSQRWEEGNSSGKYVSACHEPEVARGPVRNAPSYRMTDDLEEEYSDADSDETIRHHICRRTEDALIEDDNSQFTSAASRWTEGEDDPRRKQQPAHVIAVGGQFVQESTKVERKFVSDTGRPTDGEYVTATGTDETKSLSSEAQQSWSIVSSDGSFGGYDRRRAVGKFDNEEGTTSFSLASSCWCTTPTLASGSDVSEGGYSANARLDSPLMGDFRSRSNIVLRRSNSSLHESLRALRPADQIQADGSVLVILGGINPEDPMREDLGAAMLRYLFDDDEWELCGFMPHARSYHTAVHVGSCIYVIGGFNLDALEYEGPAPSAYCFCLDIEKMAWKKCPSMSQARACHACVAVGERIYVAGGKDNTGRITNTAEFFDVDAGHWVSIPNLPRPLMASAAAHFNSRIWVLGGVTYSTTNRCKVTGTVFEFDLQHDRWFQSVSLWTPLAHSLALTTMDSSGQRLWLWGGMDENGRSVGELRLWKPNRRVWKTTCLMQRPRHAFFGAAIGDLMCILGGTESRTRAASDANTRVDVAARKVYAACPLPHPLTGASAVVLPPQPRPSSPQTTQRSDDDSTDGNAFNLRTVYRRYRQRRKVKEEDEATESQFPAVGVYETTRILDSTFDSARIRRQEILREQSPVHGTKEERLAMEIRDNSREQRKELEKKRKREEVQKAVKPNNATCLLSAFRQETWCSEATGRRHSYQILAPSVDPNLGLALILESDNKTCSAPYSETAMVIDSIRRCKKISSAATWGILSFGGIDLNRPACQAIGRLALYFGALKNGWEKLDPMPEPRNYHTASLVGDEVFVVGGCDPSRTRCDEMVSSDSVFCFSTGQQSWSERAKLPEARAFHGAAVVGDQLYVVGGRDQSGSYLDTVAVYSPMLNAWSVLLNLPVALMGAAVVAYQGRIWVLGGVVLDKKGAPANSAKERPLDDVFIVDTRRRRCFKGPSLPFPCAFGAGAVSANQIWLCGGLTPDEKGKLRSTCNIYVLDDDTWVFYDVISLNRHAFPAASYADMFVMVFGGVSTSHEGSVDECEVFYTGPGHGNLRLRSPPFRLAGHACVVLPPRGGTTPNVRDIWRRMCEVAQRT